MAKDFSKLTDEKLRAQAERLRPRMERADRDASWLFQTQTAPRQSLLGRFLRLLRPCATLPFPCLRRGRAR